MRRIVMMCVVVCTLGTTGAVAWGATTPNTAAGHSSTHHAQTHRSRKSRKSKTAVDARRHKKATARAASVKSGTATMSTTAKAAGADPVMFGDQNVESFVDNDSAGLAEAFPYAGQVTGQANTINVYVDSGNRATNLVAAIYANNNGHPGSRLATGSVSSPKAGAWNTVNVGSAAVTAGKTYWIALLGRGGELFFRDRADGPCDSENSAQSNLSALPTSWSSGDQWNTCPVSAYVGGTAGGGTTTTTTTTSTTTSTTSTTPIPPLPVPPLDLTAPQISGSTVDGDTLTASTGTWLDSPTGYSYQWQDCSGGTCENISGATGSSHTLTAGDIGYNVDVIVTASNAAGSTPATSAQTAQVSAPPAPTNSAAPQISGTTTQGDSLTTTNGSWTGSPTSYAYQWQHCASGTCSNISGATTSSYTLGSGDVGDTVDVIVKATNAGGTTPATSAQTATVASPAPASPTNSAAPQISGTTTQGDSLTATHGTWTGSPTSYAYQWQHCASGSCSNISGATTSSYTLGSGDVGDTIDVIVKATNTGGSTSATSAQTATVASSAPAAPTNAAAPQISGTTTQGDSLTTTNGSWTGSPTSYTYQWQHCASGSCSNITGATTSSYTLGSGDVGDTIDVIVKATNTGGSTSATSAQTATVASSAPAAPTNAAAPQISGTTTQGDSLTTTNGTWTGSPTSYAYQWQHCASGSCSNISGATTSSYTLGSGDVGDTIDVIVKATNTGGSTSATSAQTATVASSAPAAPTNSAAPQISGTTTQGDSLTTTNGTWTSSPTSYTYQWQDCASGTCNNITGATTSSYTLGSGDVGDTIDVIVKATNTGGTTPATSAQTATIAASSGGSTPENCLQINSGQINYSALDNCGYPSPDTTGVPAGTTLTSVGSINCSNETLNAVSTTGNVTLGNNCIITNSRLMGGQITVGSGISGVQLTHDEISGPYTGTPTDPTCSNDNSSDVLWEGSASGLTMNYDYLHCAAEPFNGNGVVKNSYIIADECWGPCGSSSTTHNEALYIPGGGSGGTDVDHDTILNPWPQTAGIFRRRPRLWSDSEPDHYRQPRCRRWRQRRDRHRPSRRWRHEHQHHGQPSLLRLRLVDVGGRLDRSNLEW